MAPSIWMLYLSGGLGKKVKSSINCPPPPALGDVHLIANSAFETSVRLDLLEPIFFHNIVL